MLKAPSLQWVLQKQDSSRLAVVLQWSILAVAVLTLLALTSDSTPPNLARLMALSLTPLLGFEFLNLGGPFRAYQSALAAALGGCGAVAALLLGGSGAELLLVGVIVVSGLSVIGAVGLRLQDLHTTLIREQAMLRAARHQTQEAEARTLRLGGAAHDINNLLTVIIGSAEILHLRADLSPSMQRDLDRLVRSTEQALQLGRELLSSCRQQTQLPSPINLNGIVHETRQVLEQLSGDVRLSFTLEKQPLIVSLPPGAGEQILLNLVVNAVHAKSQSIQVQLSRSGRFAHLQVTDDGVGMPPHVLTRAREAFFTTRKEGKGTGMGLYTVSSIAQRAGGQMDIQSKVGAGTRIRISLPVQ